MNASVQGLAQSAPQVEKSLKALIDGMRNTEGLVEEALSLATEIRDRLLGVPSEKGEVPSTAPQVAAAPNGIADELIQTNGGSHVKIIRARDTLSQILAIL